MESVKKSNDRDREILEKAKREYFSGRDSYDDFRKFKCINYLCENGKVAWKLKRPDGEHDPWQILEEEECAVCKGHSFLTENQFEEEYEKFLTLRKKEQKEHNETYYKIRYIFNQMTREEIELLHNFWCPYQELGRMTTEILNTIDEEDIKDIVEEDKMYDIRNYHVRTHEEIIL